MLKGELKKEDFLGVIKGFIKIPDKTERSLRNPKRLLLKKIYFNEKLQKDHLLLVVIEQE